jgi:hypothetical protein
VTDKRSPLAHKAKVNRIRGRQAAALLAVERALAEAAAREQPRQPEGERADARRAG